MAAGSDGTGKENTLVIQNKLELLSQSGPISRRSGCGLLFPKKCVTHSKPLLMPGSSFLFQLMLFFFSFLSVSLTHFPPFILTSTLLLFLPFNSFTLSLSLHLPPALIRPHVTLFCICIKSPSLSALGLDYHLQLSFCPSVDGFEVLL